MNYYDRFSGKHKFRQDGSYGLKSKDQTKEDWRTRKGFTKDQAKERRGWYNLGRYYKSKGNKKERRWVRRMLYKEAYDDIWFYKSRFVSSWDAY